MGQRRYGEISSIADPQALRSLVVSAVDCALEEGAIGIALELQALVSVMDQRGAPVPG